MDSNPGRGSSPGDSPVFFEPVKLRTGHKEDVSILLRFVGYLFVNAVGQLAVQFAGVGVSKKLCELHLRYEEAV